ncbi:MAG: hypothetical protein AVDCRST_MAG33-1352 [uncultured Thermomicrobiales bacterium]|uniref:Uncharacterized protein n=1 Tax=uncultured Thermomicrobiales bacterium TaxID=1645740 RepID=A0A6J4UQC3_9BACT|nr:MAG: hypothetical protein AVDCRST_MAG33-1352 [uncultured Thermomicrobiales bacterium]
MGPSAPTLPMPPGCRLMPRARRPDGALKLARRWSHGDLGPRVTVR